MQALLSSKGNGTYLCAYPAGTPHSPKKRQHSVTTIVLASHGKPLEIQPRHLPSLLARMLALNRQSSDSVMSGGSELEPIELGIDNNLHGNAPINDEK